MNKSPLPLTMSVAETVAYLSSVLGGKPARWTIWLANDRKPGRAQYLRVEPGPGRPRYARSVVDAYVDAQRAKRLREQGPSGRAVEVLEAFGIGTEAGSSTGRRFSAQVLPQLDEGTGVPFVQLITASPLAVYRLSVTQAREVAAELTDAADRACREVA